MVESEVFRHKDIDAIICQNHIFDLLRCLTFENVKYQKSFLIYRHFKLFSFLLKNIGIPFLNSLKNSFFFLKGVNEKAVFGLGLSKQFTMIFKILRKRFSDGKTFRLQKNSDVTSVRK